MRISRTKSISLPPEQLRRAERLAKRENRTLSELVREALRHYEQRQQALAINYDLIHRPEGHPAVRQNRWPEHDN